VLALAAFRLAWRLFDEQPVPPAVSRWMGAAAKIVQALLYALLFAVPLTAIFGAWLENHPLTFLGGVEFQPILAASHTLGTKVATVHIWLGDAILWLAGFHALTGLYHHLVLKDEVLLAMLPRWLSRSRR
jgi:cytochrome b561